MERFTQGGGFLLFNGLTPEGLASYNKVVGFEHMIRPCKRERVVFPAVRDPLTAGLTTGDVALYSSQRIFPWTEGNYVVSDEFSYVIDYDEVAPFGKSSFFAYDNIVNGFVNADGWPLIINFPINKDGSPYAIPITLPKRQAISEFTWIGNTNYYPQSKVNLVFDGDPASRICYDVAPTGDPQVLPVDPPRTARQITLEVAGWQEKAGSQPLVGIDNIYLKAQRPAEFYGRVKPLVNIGGMMHYVCGPGGIVLCNLKFQPREELPANALKKQTILATLLRNMKAPFSGGRSVIAGADLEYHAIDLSKQANQYRDEKGWFGDRRFTFRDLPLGKQKFAGVPYDVYEFATSPVPTVVMLAGKGVPGALPKQVAGIPVGRKADALFFLHAARIDRPMSDQERKQKKRFELFRYVVHYADGSQADVPVFSQIGVDHYYQDSPRALPGAQIAWTKPYAATGPAAVAYAMQWNNPQPEKEIATIDVAYGPDPSRGVPAVLAITAAAAAPATSAAPATINAPPGRTQSPADAYPPPAPPEDPAALGQGIQRTMGLLANSTPAHRNKVRILFYGQSITEQDWWKRVAADLRRRFPHADLDIRNRAIGGFAAQWLIRPAEHDLYPFYPDLLVFHVYGSNQEYEQIIKNVRTRTTAEVLMQKDHVTAWPPAAPDEKKNKSLWWDHMMNHVFLPAIAKKYGCALLDIRTPWLAYLRATPWSPRHS